MWGMRHRMLREAVVWRRTPLTRRQPRRWRAPAKLPGPKAYARAAGAGADATVNPGMEGDEAAGMAVTGATRRCSVTRWTNCCWIEDLSLIHISEPTRPY